MKPNAVVVLARNVVLALVVVVILLGLLGVLMGMLEVLMGLLGALTAEPAYDDPANGLCRAACHPLRMNCFNSTLKDPVVKIDYQYADTKFGACISAQDECAAGCLNLHQTLRGAFEDKQWRHEQDDTPSC
ncbi:hypothetical protein GGR56DRAFT_670176 [Xylariaceae sp. FL0804]|nr:hypothetical protein GGR56DRAFT_670176 [Xylariaceae sp. FL0804]